MINQLLLSEKQTVEFLTATTVRDYINFHSSHASSLPEQGWYFLSSLCIWKKYDSLQSSVKFHMSGQTIVAWKWPGTEWTAEGFLASVTLICSFSFCFVERMTCYNLSTRMFSLQNEHCIVSLFDVLKVLVSHQHELSYAPSIRATLRMTCYIVDTSMVSLQHEAFYGWPVCWMLRRIWYILDSCRVFLLYELSNENSAWLRLWTIWYILNSYTILSLSELCFAVPWYSLMKQRTFLDSQFCLSSWKILGIIASRRN